MCSLSTRFCRRFNLTTAETKSVDGMKITVESIKDDTEHMSSSIVDIKRGQETLQDGQDKIIDVLNAFYTVFQNSK